MHILEWHDVMRILGDLRVMTNKKNTVAYIYKTSQ